MAIKEKLRLRRNINKICLWNIYNPWWQQSLIHWLLSYREHLHTNVNQWRKPIWSLWDLNFSVILHKLWRNDRPMYAKQHASPFLNRCIINHAIFTTMVLSESELRELMALRLCVDPSNAKLGSGRKKGMTYHYSTTRIGATRAGGLATVCWPI